MVRLLYLKYLFGFGLGAYLTPISRVIPILFPILEEVKEKV